MLAVPGGSGAKGNILVTASPPSPAVNPARSHLGRVRGQLPSKRIRERLSTAFRANLIIARQACFRRRRRMA